MSSILRTITEKVKATQKLRSQKKELNTIASSFSNDDTTLFQTPIFRSTAHSLYNLDDYFTKNAQTPAIRKLALKYCLARVIHQGKGSATANGLHMYGIELFGEELGCKYMGEDRKTLSDECVLHALSFGPSFNTTEEDFLQGAQDLLPGHGLTNFASIKNAMGAGTLEGRLCGVAVAARGMNYVFVKNSYLMCLAAVLLAIAKTGSASSDWISRKVEAIKSQLALTELNITSAELSYLWANIIPSIEAGRSVKTILDSLNPFAQTSGSITIKTLITQIENQGMTAVTLIRDAFQTHPNFAWSAVFKHFPVLKVERRNLFEYLRAIEDVQYGAIEHGGASSLFPNLAGLAYFLLKCDGTHKELEKYQGVGSPSNKSMTSLYRDLESWVKVYADLKQDSGALYPKNAITRPSRNREMLAITQILEGKDPAQITYPDEPLPIQGKKRRLRSPEKESDESDSGSDDGSSGDEPPTSVIKKRRPASDIDEVDVPHTPERAEEETMEDAVDSEPPPVDLIPLPSAPLEKGMRLSRVFPIGKIDEAPEETWFSHIILVRTRYNLPEAIDKPRALMLSQFILEHADLPQAYKEFFGKKTLALFEHFFRQSEIDFNEISLGVLQK